MSQARIHRWYDALILFLSIYVLVQLSLEIILTIPDNISLLLSWIDFSICVVFLIDWIVFFILSKNKKTYFKRRIFDLIASIPFTQILRPLRVLRVIRLTRTLRIMRGLKGANPVFRFLLKNPARSALTIYLSFTLLIYFYCSLGLYNFEKGFNASINNFGDVLWMAFTSLTSVGYGDIYPVTSGGRILAVILVTVGMGLFALVTAEIATVILKYVKAQDKVEDDAE